MADDCRICFSMSQMQVEAQVRCCENLLWGSWAKLSMLWCLIIKTPVYSMFFRLIIPQILFFFFFFLELKAVFFFKLSWKHRPLQWAPSNAWINELLKQYHNHTYFKLSFIYHILQKKIIFILPRTELIHIL